VTTLLAIGSTIAAWIYRDQRNEIGRSLTQVQKAETEGRERLFESLVSQAQARRVSRRIGQRFETLDALGQAAKIARELKLAPARLDQLRDGAIASLALPDLKPTGRVITRPPGVIVFAFDSTMTRYALRFRDGTISVRRVIDDSELARFQARGDREIFVFSFSPDGRYLASRENPSGAVTVWDVDWRVLCLRDPGSLSGLAARFSPDSRRIAVAHVDGSVVVHDLKSGQPRTTWRGPAPVRDLAYRPDGKELAVIYPISPTTCHILDTDSGRILRAIPVPSAYNIAWSPDGTMLAITYPDSKISIWDAATLERKAMLEGATNQGHRIAFHPAGTILASNGWETRLRFWDPILGRQWLSVYSADYPHFSQDGRIVVSAAGKLTTYLVDPALEYRTLTHASAQPMTYARPSIRRDGRILAVGTDRGAVLWDLARGTEIGFLPISNAWHLMFEPSGDLITNGSAGVLRWPIRLDATRSEFGIGPPLRLPLPASQCAIDEDRTGQILAVANHNFAHVATPRGVVRVGQLDDCRYVAVSPDGRWLATGSHHFGAQIWRIADGSKEADLPIDSRTQVVFSPDGKWLMTAGSSSPLWDVGTWCEASPKIGGEGACFSPDGRLVVVRDASRILRLVEIETGRTLARLESPDLCDAFFATFSPDGSRLVVTTNDGPAVHVWDLRAIRRRLARIGLDWDAPAYSDDDPTSPTLPPLPTLQVDLGPSR
jgi:WD40 repeat protein